MSDAEEIKSIEVALALAKAEAKASREGGRKPHRPSEDLSQAEQMMIMFIHMNVPMETFKTMTLEERILFLNEWDRKMKAEEDAHKAAMRKASARK